MLQLYKKIPKCINCMHYKANDLELSYSKCRRIFVREHPYIETYYQPNAISARSYKYLCGFEGKYFVDKIKVKNCNISHIIG